MQPITHTRRIAASSSGSGNDIAHIDIGANCVLVGIDWHLIADDATDGDRVEAELSVASVSQLRTNDAQGILGTCAVGYEITTSGAMHAANKHAGPFAIALPAGTRVYLHTTQGGTNDCFISVTLHLRNI